MTVTVDLAPSPLADARTNLAAAIETATGYTTHPSKPAGVATPCIVVEPAGWVSHQTADMSVVIYKMTVTCLLANQGGNLAESVEELARLAWVACLDHGCKMPECPEPGAVSVGNADYAGVQFTATLLVTVREI